MRPLQVSVSLGILVGGVVLSSVACTESSDSLLGARSSSSSGGADGDDDSADGSPNGSNRDGGGGGSDGSTKSDGGNDLEEEPGSLAPGTTTRQLTVAGTQRTVIIIAPSQVATKALPLVVALHGNGDSAANFVQTSTLATLAEERGFVLAAPQGISRNLTIGAQTIQVDWDAYQTTAQGNIDTPLVDEIVEDLVATKSIDTKRISTYGYSQGGYFSFRYGIDRSATLACAAVIAAASPGGTQLTTTAARKIPFSMQIGTNDFGIAQARATKADLEAKSFPLEYREIQGAGHAPFPGSKTEPLDDCLARVLP